jgi:hypothetical protein
VAARVAPRTDHEVARPGDVALSPRPVDRLQVDATELDSWLFIDAFRHVVDVRQNRNQLFLFAASDGNSTVVPELHVPSNLPT